MSQYPSTIRIQMMEFLKSVVDIKSGIILKESTVIMAMMRNRCLSVSSRKWIYWKRRFENPVLENGFACVTLFRIASGLVWKFKFITLSVVLVAAAVTRHFLSNRHVQSNSNNRRKKKLSLRFGLSTFPCIWYTYNSNDVFLSANILHQESNGSCFLFGRVKRCKIKAHWKIYQMSNSDHSLFHRPSFD